MASEIRNQSPESELSSLNFKETELTLGLPGESRGTKRGHSKTVDPSIDHQSDAIKPPAKTQVVGWPPVRAFRKNAMKSCKYVKVAVDGAPFLRKVDLEIYGSYQQLLNVLEDMFSCISIRNYLNERNLVNGSSEYVPTYEDKDGDWMLVGDVPWKMFVESCKRVRLMKSSDAAGLVMQANRSH